MTFKAVVDVVAETLGRIVMDAIRYRDQLKSGGATDAQLNAGLESVLRARWPKPHDRTIPWRYICEDCGDTGMQTFTCRPGNRCNGISTRTDSPFDKPGKHTRLCVGSNTIEHDYGVPCLCAKGARFRPRREQGGEDFTTATKSKPKPMTKWGR